jgi:hypothetical protein
MPTEYNDANILCPFYKRSAKQSISCEGITEDCILKTIFSSPRNMHLHRLLFCEGKYKNCEIFTMLEKKYEE